MGIIVNFSARTVAGFTSPGSGDFPVAILGINGATISFGGSEKRGYIGVNGAIDRVTGDLDATLHLEPGSSISYSLKCKPTQRMF